MGGRKAWLNGLLFGLTVLTTWFAGLLFAVSFLSADGAPGPGLLDARVLGLGFLYSLTLMIILTGHELGHFLTCRRYGVEATFPYFMPGLPPLGTFGAFIRMRAPLFRRQLFDIGANGPFTGFLLALSALVAGMALSRVGPMPATADTISFAEPLAFRLLSGLFFGPIPEGSTLILHPVGFAGWVGLLVTALNLVPLGQLDGGHVAYALLGRRARLLSWLMAAFLVLLGFFVYAGWLLLAAILLVFTLRSKMRLSHPPVLDEGAPLGRKRTILSVFVLLIFVLSFMPEPASVGAQGAGLLDLIKGLVGRLR